MCVAPAPVQLSCMYMRIGVLWLLSRHASSAGAAGARTRLWALGTVYSRFLANVYVFLLEIPGKCHDMTFVYLTFVDPISWQMSRHDMTFVFTPITFTTSGKCRDMAFVYLTFVDPISWQMSRHDISLKPAEANVAKCHRHF